MEEYIKQLDKIIKTYPNATLIYRGQFDKSWGIKSTALRRLENSNIEKNKENYDIYHTQLIQDAKKYKYHKEDNLSDIELLSKLQHYGASTGLIDFSFNFLIALWFASENEYKDGAVFIVDINNENIIKYNDQELFKKNDTLEEDKKHYFIDDIFINDNRISAQQGVFLFGYTEINALSKIIIKKEDKQKIRNHLKKMFYIDEESLFRDIYGFSAINNIGHPVNKDLYKQHNDKQDYEKYLNEGNEYYYKNKYKEAINSYQQAVEINPQKDEAYNNMGIAYANLTEYQEAINSYQQAVDINPQRYEAYYNMGNAYDDLKEYHKAIKAYQKALKINPQDDKAYVNMGIAYANLKEYDQAIKSYQQAVDINPQYVGSYINLFKLQLTQNQAFDQELEKQYLKRFGDNKESKIKYDMLKVFENITHGKESGLEVWKREYEGVGLGGWSFDELSAWIDEMKDTKIKERLLEALRFFDKR